MKNKYITRTDENNENFMKLDDNNTKENRNVICDNELLLLTTDHYIKPKTSKFLMIYTFLSLFLFLCWNSIIVVIFLLKNNYFKAYISSLVIFIDIYELFRIFVVNHKKYWRISNTQVLIRRLIYPIITFCMFFVRVYIDIHVKPRVITICEYK